MSTKQQRLLLILGSLWVVLMLVPERLLIPPTIGLDPSWKIGLNLARDMGLVFGQDYLYTYGPLGFLWTRLGVQAPWGWIVVNDLTLIALSVWGFLTLSRRPGQGLLGGLLLLAFAFNAGNRYPVEMAGGLFGVLCLIALSGSAVAAVAANALALVFIFSKINYGFIALPMAWLAWGWSCHVRQTARPVMMGGYLVSFGLLAGLAPLLNVNLVAYLRTGLDICSSYNDAMMTAPAPALDVPAKVVFVSAWLAMGVAGLHVIWPKRMELRVRMGALFLLGLLFLAYKQTLLRCDSGHFWEFMAMAPWLMAGLIFLSPSRGVRGLLIVVLATDLAGSFYLAPGALARLNPVSRLVALGHYVRDSVTPDPALFQMRAHEAATCQLPDEVREQIGTNSCDIIGKRISYALINKLNYHPSPLAFSYLVNSPLQDKLNAAHLRSPHAPAFMIGTLDGIDRRMPQWEAPESKRALHENYQLIRSGFDEAFYLRTYPDIAVWAGTNAHHWNARDHYEASGRACGLAPNICVWARRASPRRLIDAAPLVGELELGKACPIPQGPGLTYLAAHFTYSWQGHLRACLLRPPVLKVEVSLDNGQKIEYRVVRKTLVNGVLASHYLGGVGEQEGLAKLYSGRIQDLPRIRSLRFFTDNPRAFAKTAPCIWQPVVEKPDEP